jgi:hypothetical protein
VANALDPRDREVLKQVQDPMLRRSIKTALHVRRYMPFYVFGVIWLVMLAAFPTVKGALDDDGTSEGGRVTAANEAGLLDDSGDAAATDGSTEAGAVDAAGNPIDGGTASASSGSGRTGAAPPANVQQSLAVAQQASGKTRAGVDCKPGVRQVPDSKYATQCTAAFAGNNGGATHDGVSADKIRVVRRGFPESANSRAVNEVVKQAGGADPAVSRQVRDVFVKHFDQMYELYGRKIEWVDYESQNGNSTDEALGKGREGACADATFIKKELKAFAVANGNNSTGISAVFAECAAERGLVAFDAAAYFPESFYRKYHPFVWNGVMECERISYQVAEYIGKRLLGKKAKYAKDALLKNSERKFGTYVPDLDGYQSCVRLTNKELQEKYGATQKPEQYNYALDVSRFPDQAAQAIVQFKAAGVTTVVLACDPISVIFLTQAASRQQYHPEWFQIGTALNDVDNAARLWDQDQVEKSLFGMSQLGATTKLIGPKSEPGVLYKKLTGKEIPAGTSGDYFGYIGFYNAFQSAGPILTPTTLGAGFRNISVGGQPDFPVGYTSYKDGPDGTPGVGDHTAIDDSREIYWMRRAKAEHDGKEGTYFETYNGQRFRNEEWPKVDEPPFTAWNS